MANNRHKKPDKTLRRGPIRAGEPCDWGTEEQNDLVRSYRAVVIHAQYIYHRQGGSSSV